MSQAYSNPKRTPEQDRTLDLLRAYAEEYGLVPRGAGFHNGLPYVDYRDPKKRSSEPGAGLRALVMPNGSVHGPARLQEAVHIMADARQGRDDDESGVR